MSVETILSDMLDDLPDNYQKSVGFPTYDILHAAAIALWALEQQIDAEAEKLDVDNLFGDELTRFCAQFRAINRRAATYASGMLTVNGSGTVRTGALFESTGGVQFVCIQDTVVLGVSQVPVQAVQAGAVGNVPAKSVTEIPVTIAGIVSVSNDEAMTGGYEAETDQELRYRYYLNVQEPPTSGNVAHYKAWALEVAGVGMVKVFSLGHGNWTVDVVLVDNTHQPADEDLVEAVQNHIDEKSEGLGNGRAPIGARCYVSAATARPIDVSATVTMASDADLMDIQDAFKSLLVDYLADLPFTEDTVSVVSYAQIGALLLDVPGVLDYTELTVGGGTSNIEVGAREVATAGEVTLRASG